MIDNQQFTKEQLAAVRGMSDFDLTMFLSELHDHGAEYAVRLIPLIQQAAAQRASGGH